MEVARIAYHGEHAQPAAVDHFLRREIDGQIVLRMADHDAAAPRHRRADDLVAFAYVKRHRLFQQHMAAPRGAEDGSFQVEEVRQHDNRRVGLLPLHHLPVIAVRAQPVDRRPSLRAFRRQIGYGHGLKRRMQPQRFQMMSGDRAAADQYNPVGHRCSLLSRMALEAETAQIRHFSFLLGFVQPPDDPQSFEARTPVRQRLRSVLDA